jgi:hypothetical protein
VVLIERALVVKTTVEQVVHVVRITAGESVLAAPKTPGEAKDGSAEGFSHSSCEVVSFNLSTQMRERCSRHMNVDQVSPVLVLLDFARLWLGDLRGEGVYYEWSR